MSVYKSCHGNAAGVSNLDLCTLTDTDKRALEYGVALEPTSGPSWGWTVKDFGGGLVEAVGTYSADGHFKPKKGKPRKPRALERSEMTEEDVIRSCDRSKRKIKDLTKVMRPDKMITCTTRAAIVEFDQFKDITTHFFRLCRKQWPNFTYVAVFERHMSEKTSAKKFGSLHLHFATRGKLDYNKLRHFWRHAVDHQLQAGDFEGANINATGQRKGNYNRNNIAKYLAKYISKDVTDEITDVNKRRYWASKNIAPPVKKRFFTVPAAYTSTYKEIFSGILGVDFRKVFIPEVTSPNQRRLIWLST